MLFTAPVLLCLAGSQSSATLRYKFKPGENFRYALSVGSSMSRGNSTKPFVVRLDTVSAYQVSGMNKDGSAKMTVTVEKASAVGLQPSMMRNVQGKKSSFNMSPTGKVTNLTVDAASFRTAGFDSDSTQMLTQMPPGPVHVGSSWTSGFTAPHVGNVTLKNTVKSLSGGMARIHAVGHFDIGAAMKKLPMSQPTEGNMDLAFDYVFNIGQGQMLSMSGGGNYKMTVAGRKRPGGGQAPPTVMAGTETYTLKLAP